MTEKIIIPVHNNHSDNSLVGVTEYLKCPGDNSFEKLCDSLLNKKNSELTGFLYNLYLSKPLTSRATKHIIKSLFYEGRFIEVLYFCNLYKDSYGVDKELAIIKARTRILSGLLHREDNIVKECVSLGVQHFIILAIKLELALRAGENDRAHKLAVELYSEPKFEKQSFKTLIEAALRVNDIKLINMTLLRAKQQGAEIAFGESAKNKIKRLQRINIANLLHLRGNNA